MTPIKRLLGRAAMRFVRAWLDHLTDQQFVPVVAEWVNRRANCLPSADGLRLVLDVETALYSLEGSLAVAYGGGKHPKHRFLRYPDFFAGRVESGERVLDIGCGTGVVAFHVAEQTGASVCGIDLSESYLEIARRTYAHPNVVYVYGDALRDLPGERFDVVILSNVLEHLPERATFLRKVQAAVQPSRILIRVPLFERDWRVPLKKELGIEWRLDATHETEYTLESFAEEMDAAGLSVTHQEVRWGEIWAETRPDGST